MCLVTYTYEDQQSFVKHCFLYYVERTPCLCFIDSKIKRWLQPTKLIFGRSGLKKSDPSDLSFPCPDEHLF